MTADARSVVVTGLGVVSPIGIGKDAFWSAAKAGCNGVSALPDSIVRLMPDLRTRAIGRVPDHLINVRANRRNGRPEVLGLMAFREAIEDARLPNLATARSAIVLGTAIADTAGMEGDFIRMDDNGVLDFTQAPLDLFRSMHFHTTAAKWARISRCEGPCVVVSTGCTAGIDAVGMGFDMVCYGTADVAVCGATDAPLTPIVFAAFDAIGALSKRQNDVERSSRPFDRLRDGFVLGEGAGVMVLEEREHALARRAPIYAEVTSFASLSNGYHMTDLPPGGETLSACFEQAMANGKLPSTAIDHINAHGSSTPQNDICETNCIRSVLGAQSQNVTVNSLKAMIGHALGASNAIELVACALSLADQYVFPTINLDHPDPACNLDYVAEGGRSRRLRHIAKLSNGFSGIHSTLILSEARPC